MKLYNFLSLLIMAGVLMTILLPLCSAYVCQDETDYADIPCEMITPVLNCSTNASIDSTINLSEKYNLTMSLIAGNIYNFTFPYNITTSYSILLCDNSSSSITLGYYDKNFNDKYLYFYGLAILGGIGLFGMGLWKQDNILMILSGFLFMTFGIVFINIGYPNLTNQLMKLSISIISIGLGSFISVKSGLGIIEEGL